MQTLKISKILTFLQGAAEISRLTWVLECIFRSNLQKHPWPTLGWPKVKVGQNHPKKTFFKFLHQTRDTRRFSSTLTKFNPELTLEGPKTLILIWPSERVETSVIAKIIEFLFQWLFIGWNRSQNGWDIFKIVQGALAYLPMP